LIALALLTGALGTACGKKNKGVKPSAKTTTSPTASETANVVPGTSVSSDYTGALSDAVDVSASVACGSGTDNVGACTADALYLIVCSGGKAYAFDCTEVAPGASCDADSDTNQLACGTQQ
jgi:hypothetical protein